MKGSVLIIGSIVTLGLCIWSIVKGDIKYLCYAGMVAAVATNLSGLFA